MSGLKIASGFEIGHCSRCAAAALETRLLARSRETAEGCWLFAGSPRNKYGHRQISVHDRPQWAHRLAHLVFVGRIPQGQCVLHHCDRPDCINPDHLFLGSRVDNVADMRAKGRAKNPPKIQGEDHHHATLTDKQVAEIRSRTGENQRALAREYGVSQSTVWRLLHRQTRNAA